MAHDNFHARRAYVQSLVARNGKVTTADMQEIIAQFSCSKTAIYRDIAQYHDPLTYGGRRDVDAAANQRNRAQRLGIRGSFTAQEFRALRERYGNLCALCGEMKSLGPDHIKPLSKGGLNTIDNIQPVCQSCNSKKGAKY